MHSSHGCRCLLYIVVSDMPAAKSGGTVMDVRVLKYFLTVAREGNYTVAANALHITQPTLSRQIMELEDELGKKLFVRDKRNVALSEHGILLQKHAEDILALVEKAESDLKSDEDEISGEIAIGGAEAESARIMIDVLSGLKKDYPRIRVNISSKVRASVLEKLERGILDFGIVMGRVDNPQFDSIMFPSRESYGLMMRKDNPLSEKEYLEAADLLSQDLIVPTGIENLTSFRKWFRDNTNEDAAILHIVGHYSLIYYAEMMVKAGIGSALCLDEVMRDVASGELVFVKLAPLLESEVFLVWRKYARMGKAASSFLDRMLEVCVDEE